jgi:hypothetical protein
MAASSIGRKGKVSQKLLLEDLMIINRRAVLAMNCRSRMDRLQILGVVAGFLLWIALTPSSRAQTTANITGVVTDPSKAAIPGATVQAESIELGASRSAVTDAHGVYHLAALAAGSYRVTVTRQGFATEVIPALTLTLDRTVALDISLKVGSATEQVEVSGDVPLIDTTTPATGLTITPEQIHDIPLNGRDYLDLLQMVPGVAVNHQNDPNTDGAVSVLGERGNNTGYMIDGLNNTNQVTGGASAQFNQDTISEFEVITSGYKAEFGHASGGVVNVITRTGSNNIHGLASVFLRDNALDTSDLPGTSTPYLRRWDYDVAAGGALIKDKMFWFGSAERIQENQHLNFLFPPATPAVIQNSENTYDTPATDDETRVFGKLSEIAGKHSLAQEFNYTNAHIGNYNPLSASTALPSTRTNSGSSALMIGATDTALLGRQDNPFVLNLYAQFRSEPSASGPAHPEAGPDTIFNEFSAYNTGGIFGDLGQIEFGSLTTPGYLKQKYGDTGFSLSKVWKRNTFKFGYDYLRTQVDGVEQEVQQNQLFATLSDYATYGPIDSGFFLLYQIGGSTPSANDIALRNNYSGTYFQDDYKLFKNLTINGGIRWDYDSAFKIKKNFAPRVGFSWSVNDKTVVRGSFGVFYDHFRLGLVRDIPGFGGANLQAIQPLSYPRLFYGVPTIAPALFGLCLSETQTDAQLAASGTTCPYFKGPIYGVDHLSNVVAPGHSPIPAQSIVTQTNVQQLSGLDPTTYLNQAAAAIGQQPGFLFWGPYGAISYLYNAAGSFPVTIDPSFATPFTRASTLGIQRQVTHDFVISLDLYHKGIENILGTRQTNLPFDARITGFSGPFVNGYGPWYSGKYNAAILSFEKRYSHHFTAGGSYAFTSENDDAMCSSLTQGTTGSGCYPTDSFRGITDTVTDPSTGQTNATASFIDATSGDYVPKSGIYYDGAKLDEGPSDFALRHTLQLHGMVEIPFKIQLSGLFRTQSGYHYTATAVAPVDQDGNGNYSPRDLKTGRNQFVTPMYANQDIRIARTFQIHDRLKIQPIFEFFDLFNNANPAAVQVQQSVIPPNPQPFGSITQRLPGRQGQVALRVEF